jgi:ribosomal protein S18 acetylase RimI-like enzyme
MIIRPVEDKDVPDLARIHIAGWRAAYGGLVDQAYLGALDQSEKEESWLGILTKNESVTMLARDEAGNAAGFTSYGRLRTPPPGMSPIRPLYSGEIYAIYILPEYWRRGLGRQLMKAAASGLKEMKHSSLCLWVLDGNRQANLFYKALGGQRCGKKDVEIGGKMLPEAAYGWRDSGVLLKQD